MEDHRDPGFLFSKKDATKMNFKGLNSSAQIRERMDALFLDRKKIEEQTEALKKNFTLAVANGGDTIKLSEHIAANTNLLQANRAAYDLLQNKFFAVKRAEDIEKAKHLSMDLMDQFEADVLSRLKVILKKEFDLRQELKIFLLEHPDETILPAQFQERQRRERAGAAGPEESIVYSVCRMMGI